MTKQFSKRLLALALSLCLLLTLTACAASGGKSEDKPAGKSGGAAEKSAPATGAPAAAGESDRYGSLKSDGVPSVAAEAADGYGSREGGTGFDYSFSGAGKDSAANGAGDDGEAEPGEEPAEPGEEPAEPSEEPAEPGEEPAEPGEDEPDDPPAEDPPVDEPPFDEPHYDPGEALKLTAAEWNDNANWPFFTNLVNSGRILFPSFGLDPRNRIAVTVTNAAMLGQANETVTLLDAAGKVLWTARTDKTGTAYVFYGADETPDRVVCGASSAAVQAAVPSGDPQGQTVMKPLDAVVLEGSGEAPAQTALQVMFIVDTTGSMSDEIAYLQKDFSAIAGRVGSEGVTWSVSFYRDEGDAYVTRHSAFTSDVAAVQSRINAEYADGGGDYPEAVAEVLTECLTDRDDWDENAVKVAFLIFDAPPHEGKEAAIRAAAKAAAAKGVHVVPVVASNADRDTELFGRALAILTNGTYVFLTDDSGVSVGEHLEPIVGSYTVELLQDLIVRIIEGCRP